MVAHLLHGTLNATLHEVDRLPSTGCGFNICGKEAPKSVRGRGLLSQAKRVISCQPENAWTRVYATIDLEQARVGRTRIEGEDPTNPRWDETFRIYCAHLVSNIIFTVKDDNPVGATLIGRAYLPADTIINGREVDNWYQILDEDLSPIHGGPRIHVNLRFFSVTQDKYWSRGITDGDEFDGVPRTFFRQRRGCNVSLYQDAHVLSDYVAKVQLSEEEYYQNHRCWEDIFDAISNAKHLIYIAGWSVYAKITLIRDKERRASDQTLGELLKKKADEGVRVLVLVWDDRTSDYFKKEGLMATHDQETADYFQDTKVHCVLCPRNPPHRKSIVQKIEISTMFTHHQKTVVVDADVTAVTGVEDGSEKKRTIVSFVGGIDLCDGRYDNQEHSLFRTLNNVHQNDFHQPNFVGASIKKGGPREPWHDIHCRLEGPIAWDVLYNFEQRWKKQVRSDKLIPFHQLYRFIYRPSQAILSESTNTWNVQLFRSIDGGVVSDFPKNPVEAAALGLVSGKDAIIDRSIQDAYINAIRRAKNFIYIENQYFLGSSFGWRPGGLKIEDIGALHLIPKELSLKIVSKIEAGERFAVYVVIPMWPEAEPESNSVQAILDWQRRTLEMMYADVAGAIRRKRIDANPRDYLTFFCLGNRETNRGQEYDPPEKPGPDSDYSRAQQSRRFMIYVHAKMMMVDDEYIIIGSANINQRSMDGGRDSEIAMGGYQPHHLETNSPVRGQIWGFRMALWWEHLKVMDKIFYRPETVECVRKVNELAGDNWSHYVSETFDADLPGHLLRYPVDVSVDGQIRPLTATGFFPDTGARVLGTKSEQLPAILTT